MFKHSACLLQRYAGEPGEEFANLRAIFKILEKR